MLYAIEWAEKVWGFFGIEQPISKVQWVVGAVLNIFLGCAFIAAGMLILHASLSEPALQWKDLWPF